MLRRTAKIGAVLLGLMLCALGLSLRRTPVGWGLSVPSVMAQTIWQQKCQAPLSPIVGPTWQVSNNVNGQLLQWGCLDSIGNLQIAGKVYVGKPSSTVDVQLNQAISDLANGGIVDASALGATTQTVAATIQVGTTTQTITLLIDRNTTFLCSITNNTDCFNVGPGSSIIGFGGVVTNPNAGLQFSASASVRSGLFREDQTAGAPNAVGGYIEGVNIFPNATMTFSDAVFSIKNSLQLQHVKNISIGGGGIPANTILLKVYCTTGKTCGNITFDNIQMDGGGTAGVIPVWIGCTATGSTALTSCSLNSLDFFDGVFVHPGTGQAIVKAQASNGAGGVNAVGGLNFYGIQIESSHNTDIGLLFDGVESAHVYGLFATAAVAGADVIRLSQTAGTLLDGIDLRGIDNQGAWTNTINNTVKSLTFTVASGWGRINYSYSFSNRPQTVYDMPVIFGSQTFATLGTPPNGTQTFCSDCNATCAAGAGTGRMCVRENGAWVGF